MYIYTPRTTSFAATLRRLLLTHACCAGVALVSLNTPGQRWASKQRTFVYSAALLVCNDCVNRREWYKVEWSGVDCNAAYWFARGKEKEKLNSIKRAKCVYSRIHMYTHFSTFYGKSSQDPPLARSFITNAIAVVGFKTAAYWLTACWIDGCIHTYLCMCVYIYICRLISSPAG